MYKFQPILKSLIWGGDKIAPYKQIETSQQQVGESWELSGVKGNESVVAEGPEAGTCLLYTSPSPRDRSVSRMPSSA